MPETSSRDADVLIVGSGVSGSFWARELVSAGLRCRMLEAGRSFAPDAYPDNELDANSKLYWSGGIEFNTAVTIGLLRPKVVGGGSVVNQALLDRFDALALDSWRSASELSFLSESGMDPWYAKAESSLSIQEIPERFWNRNALLFKEGFERNGYHWAPLRRAQRDCRYEQGNDCICCLAGCPIQSKQSMPTTVLKTALENGLDLRPETEVVRVEHHADHVLLEARQAATGEVTAHRARHLVLAAGAIGNSKLLLASGFKEKLPTLGDGFYTHPQYMTFAVYDEPVRAHKGPLQSLKSNDESFRAMGFKLENVFAPPVAVAMLLPDRGRAHLTAMKQMSHFACIEVAVRDSEPGSIRLDRHGRLRVTKKLNAEDVRKKEAGLKAVESIFRSTGARRLIPGGLAVGLHLMGGLALGRDPARASVGETFQLHGLPRFWAADSSVFPNAPGINPSLTIMALTLRAASEFIEAANRNV